VDIIFSALSGTNQKELQVLNLEDNKIGHASVYALCKFLQYNHSLIELNLANNKFREDDGKVRARVGLVLCSLTDGVMVGRPRGR
jgi:Ran GTPase-activating protein (RanGAP) involved in mRNA processing and transport